MECPFCVETIKDEALACMHCSRDLRVIRPVLLEIQETVLELDKVRQELDRERARLERLKHPWRTFLSYAVLYVAIPVVLLVIAHVLITIAFNISPLYLRIASVLIPFPFGFLAFVVSRLGLRGAFAIGLSTATIAVALMLVITGVNDAVPIIPTTRGEWREVTEYIASVCLAFVTGNILSALIFKILPGTLAGGGRPNPAAFKVALLLGRHVGEDQLRRRARLIQNMMQTVGPLAGVAATAVGSIYAGLKGVVGQ
ncbi:hypothetical protein HUU61_15230 [Rhodopseudomonas palustris]|nr:hypothetical protein [Rhodopseudomonas palustris]